MRQKIEFFARVATQIGESDRAMAALEQLVSIQVRWRAGFKRATDACAAPARSNVRSAPERSALSKAHIWRTGKN